MISGSNSHGRLLRLIPHAALITLVAYAAACDFSKLSGSSDKVVLRLHGSNTIGKELAPALVEGYLKHKGAKNVERVEGATPDEVSLKALLPGDSKAQVIEIKAHGSDTAVSALEAEQCDVAMMSRKMKGDELEKLSKLGDLGAPGSENVIAMDGIAVIVNRGNPVRELTLEQIAGIFTGGVRDWSEVKGRGGKITVYARDEKSGTFDTFKNLVLGKEKKLSTTQPKFEDSKKLSEAVAADPNGVGFVGLAFIGNAKAVAVYEEGGQPYLPKKATVNQRKYLLHRELYFYVSQKNPAPAASELIEFAQSDEGQDIVDKVGFVSQKLGAPDDGAAPMPEPSNEDIPPELARIRKAYKGTGNLPPLFFSSGMSDLDNKSLVDFGRIIGLLEREGATEVIVVGFTDNTGAAPKNLALSEERAVQVKDQLKEEFIRAGRDSGSVTAKGFGQEAPAQSNEREDGRRLNRRVEVYYR
jgi:phosphate transport system substrate-binding protein